METSYLVGVDDREVNEEMLEGLPSTEVRFVDIVIRPQLIRLINSFPKMIITVNRRWDRKAFYRLITKYLRELLALVEVGAIQRQGRSIVPIPLLTVDINNTTF